MPTPAGAWSWQCGWVGKVGWWWQWGIGEEWAGGLVNPHPRLVGSWLDVWAGRRCPWPAWWTVPGPHGVAGRRVHLLETLQQMTMLLSVVSHSVVSDSVTPWTPAPQTSLSFTVSQILHYLSQIHVHWVGDAIQPSRPLPSPSLAMSLSQHQGSLFQHFMSDNQSIGASASASVLPMSIPSWFPLGLTGLISLLSRGLSGVYSSTTFVLFYKQKDCFLKRLLSC